MRKFSKTAAWMLTVCIVCLSVGGGFAEALPVAALRTCQDVIEEMVVYYGSYGSEADPQIDALLLELASLDEAAAAKWTRIMSLWRSVQTDFPITLDVLPDGLPQTDSLCLVVLGFQLNPDGSMREELVERLRVALACAEKYPNALIVCTGGGTAAEDPTATEAGRMAEWLVDSGVAPERVIVENQSLTTAQNAIYTFDILEKHHPQVSHLAIISSDYHIATGTLLFGAEAILRAEGEAHESIRVASNAAWHAPSGSLSTMFQAGALIELSGDVETAFDIYYETYDIHELPPLKEKEREEAFNGTALDGIRQSGVIRVGTAGDYQPMSYLDPETNTYVGFDAELAEDLAAALGVKIEYVATSWPTLMEDTLAGKFDLAICGITITDARREQALMSDGYLGNGKTVLCRAEDADIYTSLEAINRPEVRVMENPGGLNEKFARENLPDATLIIHDVNQEIPGLVAAGEADVMITEIMEAGYYVGQDARLAAPLIDAPFTNGQLGVLMPKGAEDLLDYVNAFLAEENESGRIDELAQRTIYQTFGWGPVSTQDDGTAVYGDEASKRDQAEADAPETAPFAYENDPRENPRAMADIVENPSAVYGFSPNPESTRLGKYADAIDWTDPEQVAAARAEREAYHESMSGLYRMIEDMLHEGKNVEKIARAVSQRRNELRLEAHADDPEGLALVKQSNLDTYGDEMGPSADSLYEKYGSWQTVLEKALSTNMGMDACLGLYDDYYYTYDIEGAQ